MKKKSFDTVSVVGLGYIGLPTAAMFAAHNIKVIGVDISQHVVDTVNSGEIHIIEPGVYDVVSEAVREGVLRATTIAEPADAFLIAVPTPFKSASHEPNLHFIKAASKLIAPVLKRGDLVVLESTSPVGTTESLSKWLALARPDLSFPEIETEDSDIHIAYCPERVLPGKTMQELISNDRIIGGITPLCSELAAKLYKTFVVGECTIASHPRIAEMAKLTENSFRDVNIAFANELSIICDKIEIDVWELISLSNRHPRVNILQPGPGVGGHCIAVDPWFIVDKAPDESRLIRTAREINDYKPKWVIDKVKFAVGEHILANPGKKSVDITIACYGLTFKPDIDDLRESPALQIVKDLSSTTIGKVLIVEPNIKNLPLNLNLNAELVSYEDAVRSADIHLLLVDHTVFQNKAVPGVDVIDTKGVWTS